MGKLAGARAERYGEQTAVLYPERLACDGAPVVPRWAGHLELRRARSPPLSPGSAAMATPPRRCRARLSAAPPTRLRRWPARRSSGY